MALRDEILGLEDIEQAEVYIPEWRRKVIVRGLTGAERDRFELAYKAAIEAGTVRARLAVLACRDDQGARIFRDDDAAALATKSAAALDRIWTIASRLSGISKDDAAELEKN